MDKNSQNDFEKEKEIWRTNTTSCQDIIKYDNQDNVVFL